MDTIGLTRCVLRADRTRDPFESATDIEMATIHEITVDTSGALASATMAGLSISQYSRRGRLGVPLRAREAIPTTGRVETCCALLLQGCYPGS